MKDFIKSPTIRAILWTIGTLIILFVVFGLGILLGYRKAIFASRFGDNYYHNFYGAPPGGFTAPIGGMPFNTHGVAGVVIDVSTSSISVKDSRGNEQSVEVDSSTVIRDMNNTITIADVQVGEQVTVIGEPNANGQIEARFIRIFPMATSTQSTSSPPTPVETE